MKKILSTLVLSICGLFVVAQHNIIPEPANYKVSEGEFELDSPIRVESDDQSVVGKTAEKELISYLNKVGIRVDNASKEAPTIKLISKNDPAKNPEGYDLKVNEGGITISGNSSAGTYYGVKTLKQLIPNTRGAEGHLIKACTIQDEPRFGWRGLMLDVSRHFFTVAEVKAFIDQMSEYKFNVFHWHLTDDNGWRIEIKSLPKLTEIGAWRVERHGRFGAQRAEPKAGEKTPYGGFYTHEDIKEVVAYASAKNITIVPEIDIPGHSMAALAAYPELSTKKEGKYVSPGNEFAKWFGDGSFQMYVENTLNPADEAVYEFVDKVFTEVAQLFPGEYIHMGGDECYKGYWEESEEVKKFMKKKRIKDSHELQSYFVKRVQKIIKKKGKKMIGWDEIIEGGLAKGAAVMSWQGMKGGIHAAKAGHKVVMSPTTFAYLDYTQGDKSIENPIYADLSLEKSYQFEPVPDSVDASFILGGQANLWTEVIPTLQYAYYMTYPRAFSISETLWSPKEKKNWNNFVTKTEAHFTRFDNANTNVCKAVLDPIVSVYKEGDKLMCKLENNVPGTEIYFTIDNTYPVQFGAKYTGSFEIPVGDLSLRARTFKDGKAIGRELLIPRDQLLKRAK